MRLIFYADSNKGGGGELNYVQHITYQLEVKKSSSQHSLSASFQIFSNILTPNCENVFTHLTNTIIFNRDKTCFLIFSFQQITFSPSNFYIVPQYLLPTHVLLILIYYICIVSHFSVFVQSNKTGLFFVVIGLLFFVR